MVYGARMLFMNMCIELFVHKLSVYSDCESPSPSQPVDFIIEDNSTNSFNTSLNTSVNTSVNTSTYLNTTSENNTAYTPLPNNTAIYAGIAACVVIPCVLWYILAFYKKRRKVMPLYSKKKKCCTKTKKLPVHRESGK